MIAGHGIRSCCCLCTSLTHKAMARTAEVHLPAVIRDPECHAEKSNQVVPGLAAQAAETQHVL